MPQGMIVPDNDPGNNYDFYRCKECKKLFTRLEENIGKPVGKACQCGALRYSPSYPIGNPPAEWLTPGEGSNKSVLISKLKFMVGYHKADGEWQLPSVREWAWRKYVDAADQGLK